MTKPQFFHFVPADRIVSEGAAGERAAAAVTPGAPSSADLRIINDRIALTPQNAEDLFCWSFVISGNEVDAYGTWMDMSSLQNYARQANTSRGVPYLRHHNTRTDEMGRVYRGAIIDDDPTPPLMPTPAGTPRLARDLFRAEQPVKRLVETAFTRTDLADAPDLIARIGSGISASNSIGFSVYTPDEPGSMLECDICGVDIFEIREGGFLCPHIPGFDYHIMVGEGDDAVEHYVICTARVVNASQREASGVYLGASPGTFTLADRVAALFQGGRIEAKDARRYEEVHQLQRGFIVGDRQTVFDMGGGAGAARTAPTNTLTIPAPGAGGVADPDAGERGQTDGGMSMAEVTALLASVRALLGDNQDRLAALELAGGDGDPVAALFRVLTDEADAARQETRGAEERAEALQRQVGERLGRQDGESLTDALDRVVRLAELGAGARDRLVDELVRQMTRAEMVFEEAVQRRLCERQSTEDIEAQTAMYKARADAGLTPGRASTPQVETRGNAPAARLPNPALVS